MSKAVDGYYKVARGWMEHEVFSTGEFCERAAWLWMIEAAAWQDMTVNVLGVPVTVKRGQFSHSVRFMATKFKWSKSRVLRLLERLKKRDMIGTASGTGQLIVTICNYDKYQASRDRSGTPPFAKAGQERDKEEGNKINNTSKTAPQLLDGRDPLAMAIEGQVVRLNNRDFDAWRDEFGFTDMELIDILEPRDVWYRSQPHGVKLRWWHSTRKYLEQIAQTRGGAGRVHDYVNEGDGHD